MLLLSIEAPSDRVEQIRFSRTVRSLNHSNVLGVGGAEVNRLFPRKLPIVIELEMKNLQIVTPPALGRTA